MPFFLSPGSLPVLQYAGQPFDHSPIRFCARNGEYVTIDTSWSSFVNPWSRKVSFIMGRHKVRTGPLNEDVFTAPNTQKVKPLEQDIQELSEQIHRLLLQPVHSNGSMGLCSKGSNASHEQFLSIASSSDSNGIPNEEAQALRPMTFQEICKDVHMVKNQGQQVFIESRVKPQSVKHARAALKAPVDRSVQPMETLRAIERRPGKVATSEESVRKEPSNYSYQQINCLDGIIRYLESCSIPARVKRKCGSSSYTSSNSDDDKQKAGEEVTCRGKDVPEEMRPTLESQPKREEPGAAAAAVVGGPLTPLALPSKAESVVSVTSQCSFSSTIVHVGDKKPPESDIVMMEEAAPSATPPAPAPSITPDREQQYRKVGLTKEVLSVHTQQEEQAFLTRFKDLSQLHVFSSSSGISWRELRQAGPHAERGHRGPRQGARGPGCRGRSRKSKAKRVKQHKSSDSTSSPQDSTAPPPAPGAPAAPSWPPSVNSQASLPAMPYPAVMPTYPIPVFPPRPTASPATEASQNALPTAQFPTPLVTPMVALVLPNYVFPQMNGPLPQSFFPAGPLFPFAPHPGHMPMPGPEAGTQAPSRSSTPHSMSQPERAESPLFESRCSSPLQLNLLQMEEMPKACDRQEAGGGSQAGPTGTASDWASNGQGLTGDLSTQKETCMVEAHDSSNNDALSSSSDLLDLLLQEDSRSGTGSAASGSGSAASGSMGSGSNGGSTSASGTTSSKSSNTSKYFGSVDSSENDLRGKKRAEVEDNEQHFMKYVLQDPIWLLMANTDDKVMMTYQLPSRDLETVLKEDQEKLKQMQKRQPRFTEEQKKELAEVHSWVPKGALPKAINITACVECGSNPTTAKVVPPYDVELHDMDLSGLLDPVPMEEGGGSQNGLASLPQETAMEEEEAGLAGGAQPPPPEAAVENSG